MICLCMVHIDAACTRAHPPLPRTHFCGLSWTRIRSYVKTEEEAVAKALVDGGTDINSGPVYYKNVLSALKVGTPPPSLTPPPP
jgi:hypothetical protein